MIFHEGNSISKRLFVPILVALIIGFTMFPLSKTVNWYGGLLSYHVNLAFNLVNGKGLSNNLYIEEQIHKVQQEKKRLANKDELKEIFEKTDYSNSYPAFERNIGYGTLLSLIWKISDTFSFDIIVFLQIILNSLFVIVIYRLAFIVTACNKKALASAYTYSFMLPVQFLASYPSEEIWGIWSIFLAIYFLLKNFSYKNIAIAGIFLGLGSYIHELPHTLIKYLAVIYIMYLMYSRYNLKKILLSTIVLVGAFYIVLSPYIIRNYSTFGFYFETRYWGNHFKIEGLGEFDDSFAKLDDEHVYNMAYSKAKELELDIDKTKPEFFNLLNNDYYEYLSQNPFVEYQNAIYRIPKLLMSRQVYGIEYYTELEKLRIYSEIKAKDYIKDNPFSASSFVFIGMFINDLLVKIIGFIVLLYIFYKTKKPSVLFLILYSTLIYGGVLINHVEARYFITSYAISFIVFFILVYSLLLNKIQTKFNK